MHKKDVPCIVLAINLGDVDIVKALIERGANIHETDGDKSSCLLIACDLGEYWYCSILRKYVKLFFSSNYDFKSCNSINYNDASSRFLFF